MEYFSGEKEHDNNLISAAPEEMDLSKTHLLLPSLLSPVCKTIPIGGACPSSQKRGTSVALVDPQLLLPFNSVCIQS